jgi:RimJ/RimL family protein N-acetyltransferase
VREAISSTETLVVFARATAGPEDAGPEHALRFRRLGPGDAEAYARYIGTDSPTTFRARLSRSTRCYAVEADGRILHTSWVATRCAWTRELRSYLCVGAGDAYVYESFTRADARGQGAYPGALRGICGALDADGIGRLWVAVEATNEASLRAVAKAGFEARLKIRYARRLARLTIELPDGVKTDSFASRRTKKRRIWLSRDGAM